MVLFLSILIVVTGCLWGFHGLSQHSKKTSMLQDHIKLIRTLFSLSVIGLLLLTMNFELLLTLAVIFSGVIYILDKVYLKKRRAQQKIPMPSTFVEYGRSFFPVLLAVLVIRSFIIQPVRVPTGSLEPTVLPGDFMAVSEFAYGLRLPVLRTKIMKVGEPRIGDIVVFRWPVNPNIDFVKRVVGTPGDRVEYKNKVLYINGREATQEKVGSAVDVLEPQGDIPVEEYTENLNGVRHEIFINPVGGDNKDFSITVPEGHYFMMGDNRDDSDDSRMWGFVPEENLRGKAFMIWLSFDPKTREIRWNRIGKTL